MLAFPFFTTVQAREMTGIILKNKYLKELREKASLISIDSRLHAESICLLEAASEAGCAYSSFILGFLYLGQELRRHFKDERGNQWYNLFNGFIYYTYHSSNGSHLINLTWLKTQIPPNLIKATAYLYRSATLNNPQAWLWLSYIANLSIPNLPYALQAANIMPTDKVIVMNQFDLDDIIYLASQSAKFALQLLAAERMNILHFIDPDQIDRDACDMVAEIIASGHEVAKKFLKDEQFIAQFSFYQKSRIFGIVLQKFPELAAELIKENYSYENHDKENSPPPKISVSLTKSNLTDNILLEALSTAGAGKNLKWLDISLNDITSTGIEQLLMQAFPLFSLTANANCIDYQAGRHLLNCHTLQLLDISNNAVTDEGIKLLSSHPYLKFLAIENTRITAKSFEYIAMMPALEELWAADNDLCGEGLHHLIQNKRLLSLNLEDNQYTSEDISPLAEIPLILLNINNNQVTDHGALLLSQSATLKTLHIKDNVISDESKAMIKEDNPIKIANSIRQAGFTAPVPTLKRIGIFCVKKYTIDPVSREKIAALLPQDLQNELQSRINLSL